MRFRSIQLTGYIGIYNGLHLMDIRIEFPRTPNKIVLIRGDNGSGKSTIMNALSVMPDGNECFCPNVPAAKHILLEYGEILYDILFQHPCTNGNRGQTKAYIKKVLPNGIADELNPNGNVRSYKEIIYNELGLDSNFIALSALSSENKGLASKLPSERKKFLNSIISQMDTYNGIYKSLTKRSNELKAMINSIAAKLGALGDPTAIQSYLTTTEQQINDAQAHKDEAIKNLAEQQAMMKMIDGDGSLLDNATKAKARIAEIDREMEQILSTSLLYPFIPNEGYVEMVNNSIRNSQEQVRVGMANAESAMKRIDEIDAEMRALTDEISKKRAVLAGDDVSPESLEALDQEIKSMELTIKESLDSMREQFGLSVVDESVTEDDLQLLSNALSELVELASTFRDDEDITMEDISDVPETPFTDIADLERAVESDRNNLEVISIELNRWQRYEELAAKRSMIPAACPGNCFLMNEFSEINGMTHEDITQKLEEVSDAEAEFQASLDINLHYLSDHSSQNIVIHTINRMKRLLKSYDKIFSKIGVHIDISVLTDRSVLTDLKTKLDTYIGSNTALMYTAHATSSILASKRSFYEIQKAKLDGSSMLIQSLKDAEERLNDLERRRGEAEFARSMYISSTKTCREQELELYKVRLPAAKKFDAITAEKKLLMDESAKHLQQFEEVQRINLIAEEYKKQIKQWNDQLEPLFRQRDQYLHTLRMIEDYNKEMMTLGNDYDFIEKIRYYSSPTTGIQLVFMQYYVGNTLSMANDLLSRFFGGRYVIQPFVINDSEFRIPCLGDGYINDDISSMSSAQVAMISMVISFSLLFHSSTRFNIPKLDEVDGALDINNRVIFATTMLELIDMMGIEQCFMISHNNELETVDCDVVLLKTESNTPVSGNVIFRY